VNASGHCAGGEAARSAAAAGGLVRLVTSVPRLPQSEEQRVLNGRKRSFRLFKSLSCAGDLLKDNTDEKGRRLRRWFVTLTYRPDVDWEPKQITGYISRVRKWSLRHGVRLRFVWVAEQHETGRIHYHAIIFLPHGIALPKPDKSGMWTLGHSQREIARKGVGYLMKYASKTRDIAAPWPKFCRLHGHGGLAVAERERRSWWVLPRYIREFVTPELRVHRARGGGWSSPLTGQWWPAWKGPWQIGNPLGGEEDVYAY
jgi:hypothetical protein